MALVHISKWKNEKINKLIIKIAHQEKLSLKDFFNSSNSDWSEKFHIPEEDIYTLENIRQELPNYSFLAEDLINQGYEVITINSPEYSRILKDNLKVKYSPPLIYTKGNKALLQKNSIAVVGSRNASDKALAFTDNIAKKATGEGKIVVSGYAKGVDQEALNSAIKYEGQSIIVLPQGIMTFSSGFKKNYQHIISGDILVISVFHPKSTWNVGLAMARNPIIYGLAEEIYVAESSEKGGTYAGVIDGLNKKRKIFVRTPEDGEKNANYLLINKGAVPVDFNGSELPVNTAENTHNLITPQQLILFSD